MPTDGPIQAPIKGLAKRRYWTAISLCAAAALAVLALAPLVGSTKIDMQRVLAKQPPDYQVFAMLRVPRVLLAMLAGGALALAGAVFQSLLRDALATPYTLGVSSGASLGAVTAICFGWQRVGSLPAVWASALLGAGLVMMLVLGIAGIGQRTSSFMLLLAGIAINSICSALILFVHSMAGFSQSFSILRWMMGGIDAVDYSTLGWLLLLILPASAVVIWRGLEWNLLAVGEEWAAARGVSVKPLLLTGYIAASVLTAPVTAVTGPIGFVGLIVPHALRLRMGADHRVLLPCSFFLGAAFLAICDAASRVVLAPADLPVGIITALLGGPFFIWLLRTRWKGAWL
jgi:iron complex transport system permease protein